jgi:hypothetical protein
MRTLIQTPILIIIKITKKKQEKEVGNGKLNKKKSGKGFFWIVLMNLSTYHCYIHNFLYGQTRNIPEKLFTIILFYGQTRGAE